MMHRGELHKDHKIALVIPAFQLSAQCESFDEACRDLHSSMLPDTKAELVSMYREQSLEPVISQFDSATNFHGHGSTRYADWCTQKEDELLPIDCLTSKDRYEPYLVLRYCQELPPFQEAFTGYGQNKITWVQQVLRSGWKLHQVGGSFLVHVPHPKSSE